MKIKKKFSKASNPLAIRSFKYYVNYFLFYMKYFLIFAFLFAVLTSRVTGLYDYTAEIIADEFADYGMQLENVVISGRNNLTESEIIEALNVDVGSPILDIDLHKVKRKLESNSWVKNVLIQRKLPSTINVALVEKRPLAIWQSKGKLVVIDQDGDVIQNVKPEDFTSLIHVIGEDANLFAQDLIIKTATHPELASKIQNAVRYGGRRWNLNLEDGISVQMPQYHFANAYERLKDLYEEKRIFNNKIVNIDLRDPKKIYLEKK